MNKTAIKKRVLKAIENNPYKKDFKSISLFGSYAYGKPNKKSDVDLLFEFEPKASLSLFKLVDIQDDFSDYLEKKVDLVEKGSLSKYIKEDVLKKSEKIYKKK
jgi:predicted nucleotidyltransferase